MRAVAVKLFLVVLLALGCCFSRTCATVPLRLVPMSLYFPDSILAFGLEGLRDSSTDPQQRPQDQRKPKAESERLIQLRDGGAVVPAMAEKVASLP